MKRIASPAIRTSPTFSASVSKLNSPLARTMVRQERTLSV